MKAGETCLGESRVRCLPTNPVKDWGAIRRAAGIEHRASLVRTKTWGRASRVQAKATPTTGTLAEPWSAQAG